jgi:predicted DCC family thiol-disulfide oxidoreductase YuxK
MRAVLLYDADCGLCKWTAAIVLAWDRGRRLRPLALQDPEADRLLGGMDEDAKMSSWHLVGADGEVRSAGAAFPPLFRLLPGGRPLAVLSARAPVLSERTYRAVADRRDALGHWLRRVRGEGAVARAERRIRERS